MYVLVDQVTIDTLPDDALLYVFGFYLARRRSKVEAWHTLVHVCRRWRILVFGSPRHLNLRIKCTNKTLAVRERLDIWPTLPIVISGTFDLKTDPDNIRAALEHHNRICQISLYLFDLRIIKIASLEEPFPILTDLDFGAIGFFQPFDPNPSKFLGGPGSAHLLRSLTLRDLGIPDLLQLLLATPNLVFLCLHNIRSNVLPDEMVATLSSLTRLEILDLCITPPINRSRPGSENQPLLTRTVLPSLTVLKITNGMKNVEDFMARIDAPLLDRLHISIDLPYFDPVILLNIPHLRFISHIPKLRAPDEARIGFRYPRDSKAWIEFVFSTQVSYRVILLEFTSREPEWQIPCLAQFCRSPFFPLPTLKHLYIDRGECERSRQRWHDDTQTTRWLELLQPFVAVKNLYVTKEFALHIVHALQELVGERVMEVLPTLENVSIGEFEPSGPVHQLLKEFVSARQLVGYPLTISRWD